VKKLAALLFVIGLVSAPAAYAAESGPGESDAPPVVEPAVPAESAPAESAPAVSAPIVSAPTVSAPALPAPAASALPSGQVQVRKSRSRDDYVTLNFTNIDINALIKVMSELMQRNFILDEKVTGKVTIMTPSKVSPDEAYRVFLSALEIKGFTAIEDGKVTRIIATSTVRQSALKVYQDGDGRGEGFVTKLIRLTFVNPTEIVKTITPLVTKDGMMIAYPATNSIIITDSVSNIRKIESLLHALDVAAPEGKGRINVYYLKHANAEDIGKLMQALVSRLPVPAAAGAAATPAGPATILEGAVTITADKATNSLVIVGSTTDFELMKDVLQKLDIRRRQVYVEAAIIEMSLSKQRDLGFEMQMPINQSNFDAGKAVAVGGTNFGGIGNVVANGPAGLASMNGLAVGAVKGTFQFKGVEYLSVGALLRAVQTDSDVNVLSTPNILTTDNQKAEIMVGQNVPFKTGQTQNATTGSGTLFNTIERKDVGIKLTLTPQITSDDNVRLDVNQEISDVIDSTSTNDAGPTTSKRSASTTVVVKDRETMVIGGLIRDNVVSSTMKVPLLGDIPILGWLFKYKTSRVEKTNLMIFITPYIIKNEMDSADLTRQKGEILSDFRKTYHIQKKNVDLNLNPARSAGKSGADVNQAGVSAQDQAQVKPANAQEPASSATSTLTPGKAETPKEGAR